ncbi:hypothetical protein C2S53_009118 [Perilla frutescens var. hirtella]|uniref:Protein kinase domain-containing protein n=1 Tax=Perilla frutescens var. hirtella TaxID=608512 RepID=A0AAD4JD58_PERFH|nr:hypothetical protein C2S53_009118 [Perilla frutescens var. hirtella]
MVSIIEKEGPSSSSNRRAAPSLPILLHHDAKDETFFILNKYSEGPAILNSSTGSIDGIPVYRAVKLEGQSTEVADINGLAMSLKCVYLRGHPESPFDNPALYAQIQEEERNNKPFARTSSNILAITSFFTHIGNDGQQFQCVEFPLIREGSLHSFLGRFPTRMPERKVLYIVGQVVKAVEELHNTNRLHGKICAAHIFYMGNAKFRLGYAGTSIDVNSNIDDIIHKCHIWRWATAPEITSGDIVPHDEELKTDIWMIGILALELAYSGLPFTDGNHLYQTLDQMREARQLPKNLLQAGGPPQPGIKKIQRSSEEKERNFFERL